MSDLLDALAPVGEVFDRLGVAYLLGGSVASSMHGMARSTMDIDLVAEMAESHIPEFVSALDGDYYVDADRLLATAARALSTAQGTRSRSRHFSPRSQTSRNASRSRRMHLIIVPFMSTLKIGAMIFAPNVRAVPVKVQLTFVPSPSGANRKTVE